MPLLEVEAPALEEGGGAVVVDWASAGRLSANAATAAMEDVMHWFFMVKDS